MLPWRREKQKQPVSKMQLLQLSVVGSRSSHVKTSWTNSLRGEDSPWRYIQRAHNRSFCHGRICAEFLERKYYWEEDNQTRISSGTYYRLLFLKVTTVQFRWLVSVTTLLPPEHFDPRGKQSCAHSNRSERYPMRLSTCSPPSVTVT